MRRNFQRRGDILHYYKGFTGNNGTWIIKLVLEYRVEERTEDWERQKHKRPFEKDI